VANGGIRASVYRGLQAKLVKPALLPWIFKHSKERSRIFSELVSRSNPAETKKFPVGWFHASSVGELEMLIPLIESWSALTTESGERVGVIVTIFSESAEGALKKFDAELRTKGVRLLFGGFAPWEGEWEAALAQVRPDFFVTARYEAWPELWMSLSDLEIPLLIAGARARSSLKWAKRVCAWVGTAPPKIQFCTVGREDIAELEAQFPGSRVAVTGDPRWERVRERALRGNARAKEITEKARELARPWGVLGSFWAEDLKIWDGVIRNRAWKGTLWVVPHKTDEAHVAELETILKAAKLKHLKTSQFSNAREIAGLDCVLVDEMGFLAELYSSADWAYVGGGFGQGVHSTIEPAIQALPVACGPNRAEKFPEIALLSAQGMLTVLGTPEELTSWLSTLESAAAQRPRWKEFVSKQLGASERLLGQILPWVSGWKLRKERASFSNQG